MKIALGSDHGGLDLKNIIIEHLKAEGHEVIDHGTYTHESCDYPDFAFAAAEDVRDKKAQFGIVVCTSGIGVTIVANKVKGIRCGYIQDSKWAEKAKEHDACNMVALGGGAVSPKEAIKIVDILLATPFSHIERHERRVNKISKYEREH